MGGHTFFRTITADDPEKLRQSIIKDNEYITSPKLFLTKNDFSELKQNSRLMHQYYSKEPNAPMEINKQLRFMRKTDVNMKELKKTLSQKYISNNQQRVRITQDQMAKKIIDFSYNNGIEVMKNQNSKQSNKTSHKDLKIKKKDTKGALESPLNMEKFTLVKRGLIESKKSRTRPQSSTYAIRKSKPEISRMTTQGSSSSTRFMGKGSVTRSRESYIKYLAEHKDR